MADEVGIRVGRKRTPKAGEQIAAILRSEIVSGRVADGERLGSGDELLERFGVSRPTLREALRVLEAESMITIERGTYGGVIARRPDERYTQRAVMTVLESRGVTLADVYECRTIIEPASARRLAESKGRKANVRKLEAVIDLEEQSIDDPTEFAANNVKFHELLVAASGNQTLVLLAEVLHEIVEQAVTQLTERDGTAKGLARRRSGIEGQRRLLELISAGEGAEAEEYWREYMRMVGSIMLRGGTVGAIVSHSQSADG
jgi:GntR family transcriptional repressor for pyruvate dehydrogenase complex